MPAPTFAALIASDVNSLWRQFCASMLSGSNPDGSAFTLATGSNQGGGGVTLTDRSGTLTTGGTSQQVAAANTARQYLFIQNNSSGDLWYNFVVAAVTTQPSIRIASGGVAEWSPAGTGVIPTGAVNLIGATTGAVFTAKEI